MEQLRREATRDGLDLSAPNMQMDIWGPVMVYTMPHMLQKEMDIGSKTIYPKVMEARVSN